MYLHQYYCCGCITLYHLIKKTDTSSITTSLIIPVNEKENNKSITTVVYTVATAPVAIIAAHVGIGVTEKVLYIGTDSLHLLAYINFA